MESHELGAEKMGLLEQGIPEEGRKSMIEKLLRQTFASTGHLANLLPTGTLLAFQVLVPIFSNDGQCDMISRFMTECLVFLCGISCFLACFTDSFRGSDGKIHYGVATPKGLWTFEYVSNSDDLAEEEDGKYRLRFLDFIHAVLSALVFFAFALLDDKVVSCLYPSPPEETAELLDVIPVGIAVICSLLFVVFPTTRHGIGYPVSPI